MKHVYEGKTKTVYALDDGNFMLKFKDDATGENGVFDPGANTVALSIEGMGKACLRLTDYFFKKIRDAGIATHYVSSDIDDASLVVKPAKPIGKGLEVICRFRSTGSFMRRYGLYATEGQKLDALVEITLKDDDRQDPPITKDTLEMLKILGEGEYDVLKSLTQKISRLIKDDLALKGLELYDIKLEFGRVGEKEEIMLIDEISAGNMRVYKGGKIAQPLDLMKLVLG